MISNSLIANVATFSSIRSGSNTAQPDDAYTVSAATELGVIAAQLQENSEQEEAKVRATKKIAEAKEQLAFLQRGGFPADVIAKFASQLAGQLQSAAAQYAQNLAATGATEVTAPRVIAKVVIERESMERDIPNSYPSAEDGWTAPLAQRVYQSEANDGERWSAAVEHDAILLEFEGLIRQLKQLANDDYVAR